jgi:hypothetical protein
MAIERRFTLARRLCLLGPACVFTGGPRSFMIKEESHEHLLASVPASATPPPRGRGVLRVGTAKLFMSHRTIRVLLGVVIIAAVVGGAVYWEWPTLAPRDTGADRLDKTGVYTGPVELLKRATTSVLESLPRPTVGPPPAAAVPTITWTPGSVSRQVPAGGQQAVDIAFTTSEDLSNVMVRVVPELRQVVQVTPAVLGRVRTGQVVSLRVVMSAPVTSLPATLQGTIQLTDGRTFARPFPVTVTIFWQTYSNTELGYSVTYPAAMVPVRSTDINSTEVGFYDNGQSLSQGIAPRLLIAVEGLSSGMSLTDFIHSFGVSDSDITPVTINARQYLKWSEVSGDEPPAVSYSTLIGSDDVLTVTSLSASFAASDAFNALLGSLTTP